MMDTLAIVLKSVGQGLAVLIIVYVVCRIGSLAVCRSIRDMHKGKN